MSLKVCPLLYWSLLSSHLCLSEVLPISNAEEVTPFSSIFGSPPTPGLVGFEKVQSPSSSSSSSSDAKEEEEEDEKRVKDTTPVPPVAHQGVWVTVSCLSEVYNGTEEEMTARRLVFFRLKGDVRRGDELEWKVVMLKYAF
jgi:hypothetical protein